MRQIGLVVEYQGSRYHGWQAQPQQVTVQSVLEEALMTILNHRVSVIASGRTDAGVHAVGQVVSFYTDSSLPLVVMKRGFNSHLPSDLRIIDVLEVASGFHPRKSATGKCYMYAFCSIVPPPVFWRPFVYPIPGRNFDFSRVRECLPFLEGTHDFTSFSAAGGTSLSTVRTINSIRIEDEGTGFSRLWLEGNGFLYNMVRIIAGELYQVGLGKKQPEEIKFMLEKPSRQFHRLTLPPQGLFLVKVFYPNFDPYQNLELVDQGWITPFWREKS
ncbi:MAG: tRNA pseudouridine38-40 synthase [Candidatus Atribacteria bacterium]|nr:tRNA pseudouridine38-40 synthase [Candidatus Atribacteria bacterium]